MFDKNRDHTYNHVVEKYVFYQRVNSCFRKICNVKTYEQYLNSTEKTVLPHGVGKMAPYLGQDGTSSLLPHIFPGLIIDAYFVAYNVE